jgi:hypothetical protein
MQTTDATTEAKPTNMKNVRYRQIDYTIGKSKKARTHSLLFRIEDGWAGVVEISQDNGNTWQTTDITAYDFPTKMMEPSDAGTDADAPALGAGDEREVLQRFIPKARKVGGQFLSEERIAQIVAREARAGLA